MLFDVWQFNANPPAGTWLMRVYAASATIAIAIVASSTGISASLLQANAVSWNSTIQSGH